MRTSAVRIPSFIASTARRRRIPTVVAFAATAGLGVVCAGGAGGCSPDPAVTTRTVTLHAPRGCAMGLPDLDATAFGVYRALGDFDAPAPTGGHALATVGSSLPELDPAARALFVEATDPGPDDTTGQDREWQGLASVAAAGAVDVLLLPALTSCALRGAVTGRIAPSMEPIGGGEVLVVGGSASGGTGSGGDTSALPPTLRLRLDTGAIEPVAPDLLTPRNGASVTAFGAGALVAGGFDARSGAVLDHAEVYDTNLGGFDPDHRVALTAARADAGAALLATGETLLVGGVGTDGKTALDSMEIVDPVTRTARADGVAHLAVARSAPTVLLLASGEIFVAGGVDANGVAVPTLEWFSADASQASKRTQDLVAGSARAYAALGAGGALAVIAAPTTASAASGTFQNTWVIDPDGVLEPAAPVDGALTAPVLFGGAGGAPALWTGDRWLRWQPWSGAFGALGALDDVPAQVGSVTASPDPGMALWLGGASLTALRFDVRGEYSPLDGPLLVTDANDMSPDRLVAEGVVSFDSTTASGAMGAAGGALTLAPGASAFVTDRTYADVKIELDAPTGEPAVVVLRDPSGNELEIGGASCPGAIVTGAPSSLTVERTGTKVTWTVSLGGTPAACPDRFTATARLSIGVRGAPDLTESVARNLRVNRLGLP